MKGEGRNEEMKGGRKEVLKKRRNDGRKEGKTACSKVSKSTFL